jgi:hypothetical protein
MPSGGGFVAPVRQEPLSQFGGKLEREEEPVQMRRETRVDLAFVFPVAFHIVVFSSIVVRA